MNNNANKVLYLKERLKDYKEVIFLNESIGLDNQYSEILEFLYLFEQLYPNLKVEDEELLLEYHYGCSLITSFLKPYKQILDKLKEDDYFNNKDNIALLGEIYEYILHFNYLILPEDIGEKKHEEIKSVLYNYYLELLDNILNKSEKDKDFFKNFNNYINQTFRDIKYDFQSLSLLYFHYLNNLISLNQNDIKEKDEK